jgi:hypothetical protein
MSVGIAASVAVAPAAAKEGVHATLVTAIPADARAGTSLDLSWRLFTFGPRGKHVPFSAGAVFVRLRSANGSASRESLASPTGPGLYRARVFVPDGGIGLVQIGLQGWSSGSTGTHRADVLFPITNAPVIGLGRVSLPASGRETRWFVILTAVALAFLVAGFALLVARRSQSLARRLSSSGSRPSR